MYIMLNGMDNVPDQTRQQTEGFVGSFAFLFGDIIPFQTTTPLLIWHIKTSKKERNILGNGEKNIKNGLKNIGNIIGKAQKAKKRIGVITKAQKAKKRVGVITKAQNTKKRVGVITKNMEGYINKAQKAKKRKGYINKAQKANFLIKEKMLNADDWDLIPLINLLRAQSHITLMTLI